MDVDAFHFKELCPHSYKERWKSSIVDWRSFTGLPTGCVGFASLYYFDASMVNHHETTGSVAGFLGAVWSDALVFDIDGDGDTNEIKVSTAAQHVLDFATVLKMDFDFDLQHIAYSGMKGFHLSVPGVVFGTFEPSPDLPSKQRELAKQLAARAGVPIDTAIYDATRLFRLDNSLHPDTKHYKIPLTLAEVAKCTSKS